MTPYREAQKKMYAAVLEEVTKTNAPLRDIGARHGITGERVRQIALINLGLDYKSARPQKVEPTREETIAEFKDKGAAAIVRTRYQRAWLSIPETERKALVRDRMNTQGRYKRKRVWNRQAMVKTLREAVAVIGSDLPCGKYNEVCGKMGWPSTAVIVTEYGSWNKAKRAAGLTVRVRRGVFETVSVPDCLAAVARVMRKLGRDPSCVEYETLRIQSEPCLTSVRNKLAKPRARRAHWNDVLAEARKLV